MDRLEILIDNLLFYLPTDMPFLFTLIQRPEGRYIVFGLIVVVVLLVKVDACKAVICFLIVV